MTEKPKLVHFTFTWISSGVSNFLSNISRELAEDFDQKIVVWDNRGSVFDQEIEEKGIEIVSLCKRKSHGIPDFPTAEAAFRQYLKKNRADIVHLHCSTSLELRFLRAAKAAGVPVRIAHCHNAGFEGNALAKYLKKQIHISYKDDFAVYPTMRFACSASAGEWLFNEGEAFTVVNNPIDVDKYLFSAEKRSAFRDRRHIGDAYAFCCTGRLSEQKNQAVLVEAFARFHQRYNNSVLLLAGDGDQRQKLSHMVTSYGIDHCVFFLGTVSDIGAVLSASDGYVLPSRYEGFGTAVLEAQTNGLPCLISDAVSEEADLLKTALRVPADASATLWTDGLEMLYGRSRYEGSTAVRSSSYSKEKVASYIATLYHSALNKTDLI